MNELSEITLQKQILDYLHTVGIFAWRNNSGRRGGVNYGYKGSPDIIGMTRTGRFLGIEVKRPKGVHRDNQRKFQKRTIDNNGYYIIARRLEDVMAHFGRMI